MSVTIGKWEPFTSEISPAAYARALGAATMTVPQWRELPEPRRGELATCDDCQWHHHTIILCARHAT